MILIYWAPYYLVQNNMEGYADETRYKVILPRSILAYLVCSLPDVLFIIRTHRHELNEGSHQNIQYSPFMVLMLVDEFDAYMEKIRKGQRDYSS